MLQYRFARNHFAGKRDWWRKEKRIKKRTLRHQYGTTVLFSEQTDNINVSVYSILLNTTRMNVYRQPASYTRSYGFVTNFSRNIIRDVSLKEGISNLQQIFLKWVQNLISIYIYIFQDIKIDLAQVTWEWTMSWIKME